jgi:hypothetical protein
MKSLNVSIKGIRINNISVTGCIMGRKKDATLKGDSRKTL